MSDRLFSVTTGFLVVTAAAAGGWMSTAVVGSVGVPGWIFILACGAFMLGVASHQVIVRGAWGLTLLCLAAFGAGVGGAHLKGLSTCVPPVMRPQTPTLVQVETVVSRPYTERLSFTGSVEPARSATLAFAGAGSIIELSAEENEKVSLGQTLARLDASSLEAHVTETEAALAQAIANRRRFEQLFSQGGTTEKLRDDALTSAVIADAQLKALRAQLDDMSVKAPFAGRISIRHGEVGEYASPGKPVYTLLELDPVTVTLGIPEAMIDSIKEGAGAVLEIEALRDGQSITGCVSRIGLETRADSPLYPVEVTVPNPTERLRPGMVARVDIDVRTYPAATVLEIPWVHRRGGRHFIFQFASLESARQAVKTAHGLDDDHLEEIVALAAGVGVARRVELDHFKIVGTSYVLFDALPDRPLIIRGGHLLEDLAIVRVGILTSSAELLAGDGAER